jgi:hypothetical protein
MTDIFEKKSTNKTKKDIVKPDKDSIPMRLEFIKNLLSGKDLQPMFSFDSTETEHFAYRNANEDESGDSYDTRVILKKRILDFTNVIQQMGGRLTYIKSGTTGHTFKGISEDGNFEFAVKVVAYPKKERYGNINDIRRPENAELMMLKLLSYFIVNRQTPHLVIPFGTFNTNIDTFVNLLKNDKIEDRNDRYKEFVDRYDNGDFSSTVSILISEWANKGDLLDFFRNNYKAFTLAHWKVFFFQLLSTLAIVQSKYPAFRHNDMKANNILVQKISIKKDYYRYLVVGNKYKVPNIGYHIKLWDFDFACIPGIVDNIKVESKWTKKINVTPEQNRYYDIHYFFNTLIRKGFFPQILTDSHVHREVKEFIDRVIPKKFREGENIHEKGRILINEEYLTPNEILKNDPFFEEFRINDKQPNNSEKIKYDFTKILNPANDMNVLSNIITKKDSKKDSKKELKRDSRKDKKNSKKSSKKQLKKLGENITINDELKSTITQYKSALNEINDLLNSNITDKHLQQNLQQNLQKKSLNSTRNIDIIKLLSTENQSKREKIKQLEEFYL